MDAAQSNNRGSQVSVRFISRRQYPYRYQSRFPRKVLRKEREISETPFSSSYMEIGIPLLQVSFVEWAVDEMDE